MKLLLHPLPVRIFHWTMFSCVAVLLATGLYIHEPPSWLQLPIGLARKLHGLFAVMALANLFGQIYYYLVTTKFTEVLFLPRDWSNMRSFLRYYLFITDHHPNFGRYNPGQKALFTAWAVCLLIASVTGIGLFFPNETSGLQRLLGGLAVMRLVQYAIAMFFLGTIPLHLYLVFTEEPAKLQAMFTGWLKKT